MQTNMHVHNIRRIEATEVIELPCGTFTSKIVVVDEAGDTHTLALYADMGSKLDVEEE